jgi:hypothetical protein
MRDVNEWNDVKRNLPSRRDLLRAGAAAAAAAAAAGLGAAGLGAARPARAAFVPENPAGERPRRDAGLEVLNPRGRVPLSFIIDDSTCLVNMGHYCMPQFAAAWPGRADYEKPWKTWPREIPDDFVREFGEWCGEHGVKGKYSVVPYPACVGWLDRELPGWSRGELSASLKLVRELLVPSWDIHPEMITHTRVIDLSSGRPYEEISAGTMENSYPGEEKSVDELASYLAYALRILKNCDLPCEGITTPGGFGNRVKVELSLAVHEAVRAVYGAELPHYFKYVADGEESTQPRVEHVKGLDTADPRAVVNVPAGTGDWFGGWDGDLESQGERYANAEATKGRMVELIERGEPAVMLCHWPGMYCHGAKAGFRDFQRVVTALEGRFRDRTLWMKVSEIARYAAARELTRVERAGEGWTLAAPFACPAFTARLPWKGNAPPVLSRDGTRLPLAEAAATRDLAPGTWLREKDSVVLCVDLAKGKTDIA